MNLDLFRQTICDSVRFVGTALKPADDWTPTLFLLGSRGMEIDAVVMVDDQAKAAFKNFVADMFRKRKPYVAAFVSMAWVRMVDMSSPLALTTLDVVSSLKVRHDPSRTEAVILEVADPSRSETWTAQVERHENAPPTLMAWEKASCGGGPIFGALGEAFTRGEHL